MNVLRLWQRCFQIFGAAVICMNFGAIVMCLTEEVADPAFGCLIPRSATSNLPKNAVSQLRMLHGAVWKGQTE